MVFAKTDAQGTRSPCFKKAPRVVLLPVFLCLQRKQHDLDFPTRENGKSIILFFISFGIPLYLNDEIQGNCILLDLNSNYLHIFNNIWHFKPKF